MGFMTAAALVLVFTPQQPIQKDPGQEEGKKKAEPWSLSAELDATFNDTLVRDPMGRPLSSEILDRRDTSFEWEGSFTYRLLKLDPVIVFVQDLFHQTSWVKEEDFDLSTNDANLFIAAGASPVAVTQFLGFRYHGVGGDPYGQQVYSMTMAGVVIEKGITALLIYTVGEDDYKVATPDALDRDGHDQNLYLALGLSEEEEWNLTLGVRRGAFASEGDDFDHRAWTYLATLEVKTVEEVRVSIGGSWTEADYPHGNSADPQGRERSDARALVTLKAHRKVVDWLTASAEFRYLNHGSNVDAFDYDQVEGSLGLKASF